MPGKICRSLSDFAGFRQGLCTENHPRIGRKVGGLIEITPGDIVSGVYPSELVETHRIAHFGSKMLGNRQFPFDNARSEPLAHDRQRDRAGDDGDGADDGPQR